MSFASTLDAYCKTIPCKAGDIARACGISASALSRYRSGRRTPPTGSAVIAGIAAGVAQLLREFGIDEDARAEDVARRLQASYVEESGAASRFGQRLDRLADALGLTNSEIAHDAGVDPSYISRIRHGEREPHERARLARAAAWIAANRCCDAGSVAALAGLDGIDAADAAATIGHDYCKIALRDLLYSWLTGVESTLMRENDIDVLLGLIDACDYAALREQLLAEPYWDEVLADGGKGLGPGRDSSLFFYGLAGAREAELAFISAALAADKPGTIVLNSSMASREIATESTFLMRHRAGIMRLLEQGAQIHVIYQLQRPFIEVLMGFEYWHPLYMTGRVHAHYISGGTDASVRTQVYAADSCALSTEGVVGQEDLRRCHLVADRSEVEHCKRKAEAILARSKPLVDVYRMDILAQRRLFEAQHDALRSRSRGVEVDYESYGNLKIVAYPGECAIITRVGSPEVAAIVRHPLVVDCFVGRGGRA